MTAKKTDPAELRKAAEAQLERLRGPQWSSHVEEDDAVDWLAPANEPRQDTSSPVVAEPASRKTSPAATRAKPAASRRKTTATPPAKKPAKRQAKKATRPPRRPGRPKSEVPCLPRREVRIPEVVFQRQEVVSEQTGLAPMEALWMLAHLGWCQWNQDETKAEPEQWR